jgi:hypothetical protein
MIFTWENAIKLLFNLITAGIFIYFINNQLHSWALNIIVGLMYANVFINDILHSIHTKNINRIIINLKQIETGVLKMNCDIYGNLKSGPHDPYRCPGCGGWWDTIKCKKCEYSRHAA